MPKEEIITIRRKEDGTFVSIDSDGEATTTHVPVYRITQLDDGTAAIRTPPALPDSLH